MIKTTHRYFCDICGCEEERDKKDEPFPTPFGSGSTPDGWTQLTVTIPSERVPVSEEMEALTNATFDRMPSDLKEIYGNAMSAISRPFYVELLVCEDCFDDAFAPKLLSVITRMVQEQVERQPMGPMVPMLRPVPVEPS